MSPFPRNASHRESQPHKSLNLQAIIVIMLAIQMVLTIWMWIDLHDGSEPVTSVDASPKVVDQSDVTETKRSVLNDLSEYDSYTEVEPVQPDVDSPPIYEDVSTGLTSVRLQILNGCGVSRVAAKLEQWAINLDAGYSIEDVGNADRQDYANTIIIDRTNKPGAAVSFAERLGVDPIRINSLPSGATQSDLTIIIGKDFKRLSFAKKKLNS